MRNVFVRDIRGSGVLRIGPETAGVADMLRCEITFRGSGETVTAEGSREEFTTLWREYGEAQRRREKKKRGW